MPITGPFLAGGISRNNQFTAPFNPTVNIPAGALIWVIGGTNVDDTADVVVTDTAGNAYVNQAFVGVPGVPGSVLVAIARNANALTTAGQIIITSSVRGDWDANSYFHLGAQGAIASTDVEFIDTSTTPVATVTALQAGMTLFGTVAVRGPSSDGFTVDAVWGADQKGNIPRTNVTIHAGGRVAPNAGQFSYAPVLGTARRSLIFAASFV